MFSNPVVSIYYYWLQVVGLTKNIYLYCWNHSKMNNNNLSKLNFKMLK